MSTKYYCPSTIQTAVGLGTTKGFSGNLDVTPGEREVLRSLAKEVAEIAARPEMALKAKKWQKVNDLQSDDPLVFIDPENGWNEMILQSTLQCENPLLRVWEMSLRKEIYWANILKDDKVVEPYFNVPYSYEESGWGLIETVYGNPEEGEAYMWDPPIKDYEEDFPKLKFPEITVNYEETNKVLNLAEELFGDILTVRLRGVWWWTLGMTWDFIKLRGLTNLMMDMYDYPDKVHQLMAFLRDGTLKKVDFLEKNNLLTLNTEGTYVGSGGFGWTTQLPQADYSSAKTRTIDMWGFAESQETSGCSPEMFAEFILPYQKSILERFGLNCYGCCEPINLRWKYVKTIPRLRRVSVSPWADKQQMAEYLGKDYLLSIKPQPTPLARKIIDEDAVRSELKEALQAVKGLNAEFIMKDNHTLGGNPDNASRWVEIAREEIGRM